MNFLGVVKFNRQKCILSLIERNQNSQPSWNFMYRTISWLYYLLPNDTATIQWIPGWPQVSQSHSDIFCDNKTFVVVLNVYICISYLIYSWRCVQKKLRKDTNSRLNITIFWMSKKFISSSCPLQHDNSIVTACLCWQYVRFPKMNVCIRPKKTKGVVKRAWNSVSASSWIRESLQRCNNNTGINPSC